LGCEGLLDRRRHPWLFQPNADLWESGDHTSGGQKQRVAISRAVITLPKILIFDDSLSNVDTYTEERILGELTKVMSNRTTILVSHRISTVKSAHQIVVF
jgi:ATP-binding cassette subfamily B protein